MSSKIDYTHEYVEKLLFLTTLMEYIKTVINSYKQINRLNTDLEYKLLIKKRKIAIKKSIETILKDTKTFLINDVDKKMFTSFLENIDYNGGEPKEFYLYLIEQIEMLYRKFTIFNGDTDKKFDVYYI